MDLAECDFCAHRCRIAPGGAGRCGVRHRRGSSGIETRWYRQVQVAAVDPVEKKPLYHFLPGSRAFSVALGGCNFRCSFCQNDSIAFAERVGSPRHRWHPPELVAAWRRSGAPIIAWTYTEPAVWQDYLVDCSLLARQEGAKIAMVTNGFFTPETVERLLPVVDAFNIDLKGDDDFYRRICGGIRQPVMETIHTIAPLRHLEVTTMIMERYHPPALLREMAGELAEAGVKVWHLSRFYPAGEMLQELPTSEEYLDQVLTELRRLQNREPHSTPTFIFAGNSRKLGKETTYCPHCGTECIRRVPIVADDTDEGQCRRCGQRLYGTFAAKGDKL